ncbi:hypothetical protein EDB81DRAFT_669452 [Dactylonectria macrodidyma]|uniref:Uncharacterized protein n=1 Tax=Dactylonectria macrodidyma TaxID=307937 RepID=A0A9P9D9I6_9HYPO|nr:hypothetical protein EDB81DRAFT_669502 [Dactylonectria macrodidyma]KAH7114848.1 hypothetical protein EDB81DRAFT_669452 [Dactylonectria macrodidyma]
MTIETSSHPATPEGSTPSSPPLPNVDNSRRRSPRSDGEKLDLVCNFMRKELRWGVADFVKALASAEGPNHTRRQAAFVSAAYKDSGVMKSYFGDGDQLLGDGRPSIIEALDLGKNELRKDVERLGTLAPFNQFDPTPKNGEFDALDMDQTLRTIQSEAPLLLRLIRDIMAPESQGKYQRQKEPVARIVAIISILCFSQRQSTYTGFQTSLGLYLHSKGVKRQQLELLARLGLVVSYNTVIRVIKEQSTRAAAQVERMGQSNHSVTAYDNFEVMEGVKEQRVDHQATFHSMTTGQVIQGIEMPPGGLRQNMLDTCAEICATDVFLAPGNRDDEIHRQVRFSQPCPWPYTDWQWPTVDITALCLRGHIHDLLKRHPGRCKDAASNNAHCRCSQTYQDCSSFARSHSS